MWTLTENEVITRMVRQHGYKWTLIAQALPGRTDNAVRNRWKRLERLRLLRCEQQQQQLLLQRASAAGAPAADTTGASEPTATSVLRGYRCSKCGQPKRGHLCPMGELTLPEDLDEAIVVSSSPTVAVAVAGDQAGVARGQPRVAVGTPLVMSKRVAHNPTNYAPHQGHTAARAPPGAKAATARKGPAAATVPIVEEDGSEDSAYPTLAAWLLEAGGVDDAEMLSLCDALPGEEILRRAMLGARRGRRRGPPWSSGTAEDTRPPTAAGLCTALVRSPHGGPHCPLG